MTRRDIEDKLPAYQEGGLLSPEETSLVEAHLKICPQCSSSLEDLKNTIHLLKDLPEVDPPPWFTQKVMAQVREESEKKRGLVKKLFYPFHIKIPIEAFATLLVALLGVYIYQSTQPETGTISQAPRAESQKAAPHTGTSQESTRAAKDASETRRRSEAEEPRAGKRDYAPIPQTEKRATSEQEQRSFDAKPSISVAKEKIQEGIHEPSRSRQDAVSPSAPSVRQKEAPVATGSPSPSPFADKQNIKALSVQVVDIDAASSEIERILQSLGAENISRDFLDGKASIKASVQTNTIQEFLRKLRDVGLVRESSTSERGQENTQLRIEITKQ